MGSIIEISVVGPVDVQHKEEGGDGTEDSYYDLLICQVPNRPGFMARCECGQDLFSTIFRFGNNPFNFSQTYRCPECQRHFFLILAANMPAGTVEMLHEIDQEGSATALSNTGAVLITSADGQFEAQSDVMLVVVSLSQR
ncbi:MAG: hypothetical protein HQ530_00200 [Parcubacteria group bacterium]|nr:hypothetical protein [Parcubacteria group bacterium]